MMKGGAVFDFNIENQRDVVDFLTFAALKETFLKSKLPEDFTIVESPEYSTITFSAVFSLYGIGPGFFTSPRTASAA